MRKSSRKDKKVVSLFCDFNFNKEFFSGLFADIIIKFCDSYIV